MKRLHEGSTEEEDIKRRPQEKDQQREQLLKKRGWQERYRDS